MHDQADKIGLAVTGKHWTGYSSPLRTFRTMHPSAAVVEPLYWAVDGKHFRICKECCQEVEWGVDKR